MPSSSPSISSRNLSHSSHSNSFRKANASIPERLALAIRILDLTLHGRVATSSPRLRLRYPTIRLVDGAFRWLVRHSPIILSLKLLMGLYINVFLGRARRYFIPRDARALSAAREHSCQFGFRVNEKDRTDWRELSKLDTSLLEYRRALDYVSSYLIDNASQQSLPLRPLCNFSSIRLPRSQPE